MSDHQLDICLGYQIPSEGSPIVIGVAHGDDEDGRIPTLADGIANARLMAAAPELLAACEAARELYGLHQILEYGCGGTSDELAASRRIEEINEQMSKAVKKAKGAT
jgi:hypothetical protein